MSWNVKYCNRRQTSWSSVMGEGKKRNWYSGTHVFLNCLCQFIYPVCLDVNAFLTHIQYSEAHHTKNITLHSQKLFLSPTFHSSIRYRSFFFIYNLNQQSEITFYKLMLWLLKCLDGESSSGESPVPQIRSIGQFLWSRLFSSLDSSVLRSRFSRVPSLVWCLFHFWWMTSCTYDMPRSTCSVAWEPCHGASTIILRILDWLLYIDILFDNPILLTSINSDLHILWTGDLAHVVGPMRTYIKLIGQFLVRYFNIQFYWNPSCEWTRYCSFALHEFRNELGRNSVLVEI
jgi:hypothetical protein